MGSAYRIEPDKGRVVIRARDPDLADTTRVLQELAGDPAFKPEYDVRVDLEAIEVAPGRLAVEGLALCLIGMRERYPCRVALVAPRTQTFGSFRRAALLAAAHDFPLDVFRTVERAEAWLGRADRTGADDGPL